VAAEEEPPANAVKPFQALDQHFMFFDPLARTARILGPVLDWPGRPPMKKRVPR
jgi:hypothetical protein